MRDCKRWAVTAWGDGERNAVNSLQKFRLQGVADDRIASPVQCATRGSSRSVLPHARPVALCADQDSGPSGSGPACPTLSIVAGLGRGSVAAAAEAPTRSQRPSRSSRSLSGVQLATLNAITVLQ